MSRRLWLAILSSLTAHALIVFLSAHGSTPKLGRLSGTLNQPVVGELKETTRTIKTNPRHDFNRNESKNSRQAEATEPESEPLPYFLDHDFVGPDQVDELASAEDVPEFPIPPDEPGFIGQILMKIFVNESGEAVFIVVETTTLPDSYTQLLVERSYLARFRPAKLSGHPIKSWRRVEIRIGEENSKSEPNLTTPVL
jgi:hypothetical protein